MQEPSEGHPPGDPEHTAFWSKSFEISAVSRDDLVQAGYSQELVQILTDADMQELAVSMGNTYTDTGYWEDLETAAGVAFAEKGTEVLRGNPALAGFVDEDGKLISFTSLGGYPIYYLDTENSILCGTCANEPEQVFKIVAGDVYYEGADLACEGCGNPITSAYGDPAQPDEKP